ncbi:hypothetical protein TrispH2_003618 [Trichoplax sp. H2]|nr:hypothetical protein TrispH2_003618 [Trichoplax sp. H2]|eukprot:RDD45517.1 hypothetical protein TrispH2_003618 [Trichoplax sp. H2]
MEEKLTQAIESISLSEADSETKVLIDITAQEKQQAENQAENDHFYSKAIENLQKKYQELEQSSRSANLRNDNDATKLNQLIQQKESTSKDRKTVETQVMEKTKCKQFFDLYTNISGIEWNYHCSADQIKGVIMYENDCKPFALNVSENTDFEMTNKLWQLL